VRQRLVALDVLRGLMALSVAVYHLAVWTRALDGTARNASIVLGIYSVQGFFVISGLCFFTLYGRARFDRAASMRFFTRRFLRIAPLFYAAIALSYALGQPVNPGAGLARFAENLTLSFGLFHPNHALVLGGWSIGLECLFYAAFPPLAWVTRRRGWLYVLCVLSSLFALPYSFGLVESLSGAAQFNAYVQVGNHAFLFLVGGVLADLRERLSLRLPVAWVWLAGLGLVAFALGAQPEIIDHASVMVRWPRVKYLAVCAAVVLACALCREGTGAQRSAAGRLLCQLGDLSYSVYLMHPFAWLCAKTLLPAGCPPLAQLLSGVAATLLLSAATYRMIERPAMGLADRRRPLLRVASAELG
jgi:peptidoglycan/LPS O-acetylase OafA/YrhL